MRLAGYNAGLWDNCHYNVTENATLETCLDKLTRKYAWIKKSFCDLIFASICNRNFCYFICSEANSEEQV